MGQLYVAELTTKWVTFMLLLTQAGETLNHACARYATYCKALQYIKYRFNRTCYGWSDGTGSQMTRFRAVDVARALEVLVEEGAELRVIA